MFALKTLLAQGVSLVKESWFQVVVVPRVLEAGRKVY